jgi:hypothetical protein
VRVSAKTTGQNKKSQRAREISRLLRKAAREGAGDDQFAIAEVQSFAVINGVAQFQVRLAASDNRYLYFSGPLLTGFGDQSLQIPLQLVPSDKELTNATLLAVGQNLLSKETDAAFLIKNNGSGELTLALQLNQKWGEKSSTLELNLSRFIPPISIGNDSSLDQRP